MHDLVPIMSNDPGPIIWYHNYLKVACMVLWQKVNTCICEKCTYSYNIIWSMVVDATKEMKYIPGDPWIRQVKVTGSPSSTSRFPGCSMTVGGSTGAPLSTSIVSAGATGTEWKTGENHKMSTTYELCHAKRALLVILVKMFIFLFSESTLFEDWSVKLWE